MDAKKKVLLVDNDSDFVEINKSLLEKNGYQVVAAYNANECREKVKSTNPDLIILDVMMDSTNDGFELATEIGYYEKTKDIPIIMVTAFTKKKMKFPWKYGQINDNWLPVETIIEKFICNLCVKIVFYNLRLTFLARLQYL